MNNKEQIDQAFAEIDDKLIEWAAKTPKSKKRFWKRLGTVAIAASLLIGISLGAIFLMGKSDNISANGWKIIEYDGTTLKKMKSSINGGHYTLCIDYSSVISAMTIDPKEDLLPEMFGQWAVSQLAFDYEQHFALFQEDFLIKSVYQDFETDGLTPEEANRKIAQVASDVVGMTDYRLEYAILDIKNTPELLQEYKDQYQNRFERVGLNVDGIEEVCEYTFEEVNIYYHDLFCNRAYITDAVFYKYNGQWYISPNMLEDDICIDLVQSEKSSERGYYTPEYISGQVVKIEKGYAILNSSDSTEYFLIKDADIFVGDYVTITFYSVGMSATRISDGIKCDLLAIAEVEKLNME